MTMGPARYSIAAGKGRLVMMRTLWESIFSARSIQLTLDWVVERFGVGDVVQRVDHVVGGELVAVVELHAAAQVEFQRLVVDPAPGGGELALVLVGPSGRGRSACPRPDGR
jgi:hypothetical protein